jgi:hypothetical protein
VWSWLIFDVRQKMKPPYFLVERVELAGGAAFVDGRTGEGTIPKGFIFSRAFDDEKIWRAKGSFRACHFVLRGIEAYRHSLDELDPGLTARLRIEGADLDALSAAKVLE